MTCKSPRQDQIPQLLKLWREVFGEWNGFWEMFLETAFSPDRCRCVTEAGQITAALAWLDCSCRGQKMAYVYAVVTHPDHRGRGLCRKLLEQVHEDLHQRDYAAVLLVPAEPGLREMYRKLGYETCTRVSEFSCEADGTSVPLRAVGTAEYAALRRQFLPEGSVIQEGENLPFLAQQAQFYAGADVLMAAWQEENSLTAMELLGDRKAAPGILKTLGCQTGSFRCPGEELDFAMIHRLRADAAVPGYFGFAFD